MGKLPFTHHIVSNLSSVKAMYLYKLLKFLNITQIVLLRSNLDFSKSFFLRLASTQIARIE